MTENCVSHEVVELEELPAVDAVNDTEATPSETPEISQLREVEALLEMDRKEKQEEEKEKLDGQTDTEAVMEGAPCWPAWSESRNSYPATVVAADGERSRVRFSVYGNKEDMAVSTLWSPSATEQTQNSQPQDWKPGSRCRAVYSADGLVYPAVVLWVKDQRCRVRYDEYNNEEELDVGSLLHPDELRGPSRAAAITKGSSWIPSPPSSNLDWKRWRRDESKGDRGRGRTSAPRDDPNMMKARSKNENTAEKETAEKRKGDPTNIFFPPFPPPQIGSVSPLSFVPPPVPPVPPFPPAWTLPGKEAGDCQDVSAVTNMFMLWYMCGFHTGSFLAQQRSSPPSKD
ncbi:survival motor neuron protein-like [Poeciliopsis prolifica]|uniref:survival motor neuron protein-like n=1 Tax=Poeciliopsis prolifica TaxID=188132 RepID=UPI002413B708|nr:survival motor neuron protein-like [Poeciliopsis prolifica]XP_054911229.1 survival motor neuron protein-like [Poeciliopsis prolifica]XP_054911233.1 survival motor neuron protein-like [Poeciliopsis prolifica]